MHLLVIGRSGQLARALDVRGAGKARIRFLGRETVDLMVPGQAEIETPTTSAHTRWEK